MTQPLSFCGSLVKAYDPDRFLLTMFVPEQVRDPSSPAATTRREALWALFAFNHEIAKTRAVVSEPQLGRIRLQWWRDEIERIYSGSVVPEHEVLKPLAAAIRAHDLPREDFETLITAREADLAGAPLKDVRIRRAP